MNNGRIFGISGMKTLQRRILFTAGVSIILGLLIVIPYVRNVASIEIPPEVETKEVLLKKDNVEAEQNFKSACGKCHKVPEAAKSRLGCTCCQRGLTKEEITRIENYMADVQAGKNIYESYCGRCHSLIDPGSHTLDYWSKNFCTSDSCMVERRLNGNEEQQVLLYLSSRAKIN